MEHVVDGERGRRSMAHPVLVASPDHDVAPGGRVVLHEDFVAELYE
jgi:hypothetical protein